MTPEATLLRLLQYTLLTWELEADALAAKHQDAAHLAGNIKQVRQSLRQVLELIEPS